jgi:enamine deaminase RidA (YjgF/YER057c/UK114 family)
MSDIERHEVGARMSEIAVFNNVVYLAGQVAERNPEAGIAGQTEEVLSHIDRLLAKAGTDKTRLLQCQIYLKDIADIGAMNQVWDRWVAAGHAPPRATVHALLADPNWRIEVVVSAALPSRA